MIWNKFLYLKDSTPKTTNHWVPTNTYSTPSFTHTHSPNSKQQQTYLGGLLASPPPLLWWMLRPAGRITWRTKISGVNGAQHFFLCSSVWAATHKNNFNKSSLVVFFCFLNQDGQLRNCSLWVVMMITVTLFFQFHFHTSYSFTFPQLKNQPAHVTHKQFY